MIFDQGCRQFFRTWIPRCAVKIVYQEGFLLPAIDLLASASANLNPETSASHYNVALKALTYQTSNFFGQNCFVSREAELSTSDKLTYERAKKLRNFMTQNSS